MKRIWYDDKVLWYGDWMFKMEYNDGVDVSYGENIQQPSVWI